jgi:hypothetical protein
MDSRTAQFWKRASYNTTERPGTTMTYEQRVEMSDRLQRLALVLVESPEQLLGLTVISAIHDESRDDIIYTQAIVGSPESLVAMYRVIKSIGEMSLKKFKLK